MGGQQGGGAQVRALLLAARQRQNYACLGATASPCKPSAVTSASRRLGCCIAAGARQQRGRCAARPPPVHQGARLSVVVCPVLSQPRPTCMLCLVCCAARRRRCCWRRAWRSSRCAGRCTDLLAATAAAAAAAARLVCLRSSAVRAAGTPTAAAAHPAVISAAAQPVNRIARNLASILAGPPHHD